VRIQAIVRELNDEKIDVIEWNPDPSGFIAKALSPARVTGVYLNEMNEAKTATVVVPEDQLSLAIGRDGQNARLAAKLTAWRIDIKSLPEATSDALMKLQENEEYAEDAAELEEMVVQVEAVLTKKDEGRPVTPEEYQLLARFVNRVETGAEDRRQAELDAKRAVENEIRETLAPTAFDTPLEELGISPRFTIILSGEGFTTAGDLMLQLALDSDVILSLNGIGPKAMEEIQETLNNYEFPEPAVVEEAAEEIPEEAQEEEEEGEGAEKESEVSATAEAEEAESEEKEEAPKAEAEAMDEIETPEDTAEKEAAEPEPEFMEMIEKLEIESASPDEEDGLEKLEEDQKKKRTKKKAFRQVEYDPDHDVTIVKRRRKRDEDDWETGDW
jgi:N utilization substance protein A